MTNQEIFNIVVTGLRRQGKKSILGDGTPTSTNPTGCAYRSGSGCKCAFGLLIPDDAYSPEMENHSIEYICRNYPLVPANLGIQRGEDGYFEALYLMEELQKIHDKRSTSEWEAEWAKFAVDNDLTLPEKETDVAHTNC